MPLLPSLTNVEHSLVLENQSSTIVELDDVEFDVGNDDEPLPEIPPIPIAERNENGSEKHRESKIKRLVKKFKRGFSSS